MDAQRLAGLGPRTWRGEGGCSTGAPGLPFLDEDDTLSFGARVVGKVKLTAA